MKIVNDTNFRKQTPIGGLLLWSVPEARESSLSSPSVERSIHSTEASLVVQSLLDVLTAENLGRSVKMVKISFQQVTAQKPEKENDGDKEEIHMPYSHVSYSFLFK